MLKVFFIVAIIISFGAFFYGVLNIYIEVEENACRMTYMFGIPQFSKVIFDDNKKYPHYELYYYYEGQLQKDVNNLVLKGAPVIFVPGNAGSYKQVRSLASVALRKGLGNKRGVHMDYFAINYEEELSGLFGGYLENQKQFLRLCILAVQNIYKKSCNRGKQVTLIGHSMGGKVAQAVLEELGIESYINTIILISSPLDHPVIDIDYQINQFYTNSDLYLSTKRSLYVPDADTNFCINFSNNRAQSKNGTYILDKVLMISIGGGNRDLMVRGGLTTSKYSDIHAMTSSIPNVWLSCDHLSALWCLQLMLVINRFIFDVSTIDKNKNIDFIENKTQRIQSAINYFMKPLEKINSNQVYFPKLNHDAKWEEVSKIFYRKFFKRGLRSDYNHMLPIYKYKFYKKLFIEINSYEPFSDWIYGCTARNITNMCDRGISLSHNVQNIASHDNIRSIVLIDLDLINKYYPQWTHFVIRLQPTNKPVIVKVDAYNKNERILKVRAPHWVSFSKKLLINETIFGNIYYKVLIEGLDEPFPTLHFNIEPISCNEKDFNMAAKICVPWARGFERYVHITQLSGDKGIYVNVPISAPNHYNTSENPVVLEIFLDSVCRYKISYTFSIPGTMSKIVQEFYHWLPAHLIAVLFVVLRNQITNFQSAEQPVLVKPYVGFFQCKSIYIITGCRLIKKLLLPLKFLPTINTSEHAFYVSVIIHSTAIAISIILVFIIWTILIFHGNVLQKVTLRIVRISIPSSNLLAQIISTLPLSFGVLFISVTFGTCSGIALAMAAVFYFILLSNAYKEYLEQWTLERVTGFKKLRTEKNVCHQLNISDNFLSATEISPINVGKSQNSAEFIQRIENFQFHITMLLLLVIMSVLNIGISIAWVKSRYLGHVGVKLTDTVLVPTIIVLTCMSTLLKLHAPHKSSGYHVIAIILYFCACFSIIYCQESLYCLNYLIAFVYVIVTLQEISYFILQYIGIKY